MTEDGYGALAAALAKAQAAFPAIPRDKTVKVKTRAGDQYEFKYAPLDSILTAVRGPLSENGLAVTQLLDGDDLVTMLLHSDGGSVVGRFPLPRPDGSTIQALGSAITYLRRYSIQAVLGIAAEEDDDGNHADGNAIRDGRKPGRKAGGLVYPEQVEDDREDDDREPDGLIGILSVSGTQDFNLRQTPTGYVLPFRVREGNRAGQIVQAENDLALALDTASTLALAEGKPLIGQRVTVWGTYTDETFDKKDGDTVKTVGYRVLHLTRIQTPEFILPAPVRAEAEPVAMGLV